MKAFENTWANQRRKKRQNKQNLNAFSENNSNSEEDGCSDPKKAKLTDNAVDKTKLKLPLVEFCILIKEDETSIIIELPWLAGNKESLHQILQYIKNKWDHKIS